jgi:predicted DNA-binding transcriptional regulator AlpA
MNLNFSLSNDPRLQYLWARDRHAYASQYIANMAMWFKLASTLASQESDSAALAQRIVEQLTAELGLSISACAKTLKVTRPTIYSWLKQKQAPQAVQVERLRHVSKVAQVMSGYLRDKPDLDLKAMLPDGNTILSLLCEDKIDIARIESALRTLSEVSVRHLADISDDELEDDGKVNHALLTYLRKAPM